MQIRQTFKTNVAPSFNRLAICLGCAALVCASGFAVQSAHAQSIGANQVSRLEAQASYDERTLQAFATAAAMVLTLRNTYYPRIRAAELAGSNEKAGLLFDQMREHMYSAVDNAGFTTEQYQAISSAAKTDDILRQRINSILQGPAPAQRRILTPQGPQVAAAPRTAVSSTPNVAPATPPLASVQTDAERDRLRHEQTALQEKVQKLESQLSTVKAQDTALRQQLTAKEKQALAARKKSKAELQSVLGEVANLKVELSTVQSRDAALRAQLKAETIRADAEKSSKEAKLAAFREEISRLANSLATAQQALNSLAVDLQPGENGSANKRSAPFEALKPLRVEPNSIERVLARVQPQYEKLQELDSEIAQIQKERIHREAERAVLQQEIAGLSRDLTDTYQALAELTGEPVNITVAAADLGAQNGTYTLDVSQETALLFEGIPAQFGEARTGPQANIPRDAPAALGIGSPGIEQSASEPADPRENAPGELAGLPAAENKAVIVESRPTRQIVRNGGAFKSEIEPETPNAGLTAHYGISVDSGADAYMAAEYNLAYQIWAPLADSGDSSAQFHLGALYLEGRGTVTDFVMSYFWLRVSAYLGDERAIPLLRRVSKNLSRDEIHASENQARDWLKKRSLEVTQAEPDSKSRL